MKIIKIVCLFLGLLSLSSVAIEPQKLANDARAQIGVTTGYDSSYRRLDYPLGDVAIETGVCTDVVIRALRKQDMDLQELVHEDMKKHFSAYPNIWQAKRTDSNIDHRRVPNLETYFKRHGKILSLIDVESFQVGDIVTWRLPHNLPHIGIVSEKKSKDGIPLIIHNIGLGTKEDNILFLFDIKGHYRL